MKYIVVFRPHHAMNLETQYIGPFAEHDAAYEYLCELPALGVYIEPVEGVINTGVKFIQELSDPSPLGWVAV